MPKRGDLTLSIYFLDTALWTCVFWAHHLCGAFSALHMLLSPWVHYNSLLAAPCSGVKEFGCYPPDRRSSRLFRQISRGHREGMSRTSPSPHLPSPGVESVPEGQAAPATYSHALEPSLGLCGGPPPGSLHPFSAGVLIRVELASCIEGLQVHPITL